MRKITVVIITFFVIMGGVIVAAYLQGVSDHGIVKPSNMTEPQEEPPQTELQEELALTQKLLTVPIGGIHKNFIWLKPGETGEAYYTLYTRNGGPGEVSYKIYSVAGVGGKEEMPMPEGLNVSIEPSKFTAQPHKNYTSKITVKTSPELFPYDVNATVGIVGKGYTLCLRVIFEGENETRGDDWLRFVVSPFPVPGASLLGAPHGTLHNKSITLKPGETRETHYTLHTVESGPGDVSYEIYRVGGVYSEGKIPMPEGLEVNIEPSKFFARTHQSYTSKITIETSPELSPGEYVLCMHGFGGVTWFTVNVEP